MADLDAELLALAGGDSSGEEDSTPGSPPPRRSPSPRSPSFGEDSSPDMARKGIAQTTKKAKARKPARRSQSDDEDEGYVIALSHLIALSLK